MEWRWVFIVSGLLILFALLPYLLAYQMAPPGERFMGILVNPTDGQSYLAKMRQGASGSWLFRLTFTPEEHPPVFLFTFHIFLGHLSRWLALPTVPVYHTARLVGSLFMLLVLYLFVANWTDDVAQRRVTWGLAAVGAGLGWLVILTGYTTADLTIPEAFPFYAAFANAHFPWAIAVLLYIAHTLARTMLDEDHGYPALGWNTLGLIVATIFMLSTQPFALFPLGTGVGVLLTWRWLRRRRFPRRESAWALVVLVSAIPQLLNGLWAVSEINPVFHAWHLQNQTPSPPPWDYLLAYGPLLVLALLGIWKSWPKLAGGEHDGDVFLLGWLVTNMLLLYAPFGLQRRLSIGLIVPLAVFAGRGLMRVVLPGISRRWRSVVVAGTFLVATPSAVLTVAGHTLLATTADARLYVSQAEEESFDWLDEHATPDDVVLASPGYSMYIPAQTGARVVYGHPFETLRAPEREAAVLAFYAGENCDLPAAEAVDYVVYGPREVRLGDGCRPDGEPVYASGDLSIYQTSD